MASKITTERIHLKSLQAYHHNFLNHFDENETLLDAISIRPGFFGANPVSFLSLQARRGYLHLEDLEEAIINDRTILRAPAFRGSLFLINAADYGHYFRTFHNLLAKRAFSAIKDAGFSQAHMQYFGDKLQESLGILPSNIHEIIAILFPNSKVRPSFEICSKIVHKLCDLGILVRATSKGWKGNDFTFALLSKWAPDVNIKPDNPEIARIETIKKYLFAYGPCSMDDIAWWTGLTIAQVQRSLSSLRRDIIRVCIDTYRDDLITFKDSVDTMKKKIEHNQSIKLLPPWDPYPLGWACPKRLVDKQYIPFVFDKFRCSTSVIVDAGKIIGLWQFRDSEINFLEYCLFPEYKSKQQEVYLSLEYFGRKIVKLTHAKQLDIVEKPLLKPLTEREQGSFLWPLGKPNDRFGKSFESSPMERRATNTFRQSYLDNQFLQKPNQSVIENHDSN